MTTSLDSMLSGADARAPADATASVPVAATENPRGSFAGAAELHEGSMQPCPRRSDRRT
jgi:hypothetical protein